MAIDIEYKPVTTVMKMMRIYGPNGPVMVIKGWN